MNILGILNTIADTDPEVFDRIDSRRKAMRGVATAGKALTLAAVPTLLSGVFPKPTAAPTIWYSTPSNSPSRPSIWKLSST